MMMLVYYHGDDEGANVMVTVVMTLVFDSDGDLRDDGVVRVTMVSSMNIIV